ncbi:MAG: hypothetical protein AABN34_25750 [Acidobacteriota bacterium]
MPKSNSPRLSPEQSKISDLDRRVWAESLSFTSYGVCFGVRANRKRTLDRILLSLPPGWKPSRSRVVDRLYSFVLGVEEPRGKGQRLPRVYADEEKITGASTMKQAIDAFESDLQLFVAETAPRRVFVHAGVVGWRGKAIVIPGRSFSGKTSLVAALVKAGAIYYSDEYAVLDDQGRVHHYARPLSIRENGHPGKSKKYRVEALGGRSGVKPLPVGLVVVSKYKPGARWRPRELSAGEGALELMANTVSARRQPERMLEAVRLVASQAQVLKGNRGEAGQVVDFIFERLGRQ